MSFRLKTILGIAVIEAAMLLLLVVNGISYLRRTNEEALGVRAQSTANLFASTIKDAVLSSDLASIHAFFDEIAANPDLVYVTLTDGEGRHVDEYRRQEEEHGAVISAETRIEAGSIDFGRVEIGFDGGAIDVVVAEARREFSFIATLEMAMVAAFSFLLGTHLTRHLKDLEAGALRVAAGEAGVTVKVRGRDELAITAKAFNTMTRTIAETESKLRRARDVAEQSNRMKSEFLATISHEIRTPMNGVLGALTLMDVGGLPKEAGRLAGVARRSAENLLGLLDDILDFAKLEAGRIVVSGEPCSPRRIVEEVLETFRPIAEEKGLVLSHHVRASTPAIVETDPARLRQILFNIVGNAVKFTATGEVMVLAGTGDRLQDGRVMLEFEIDDTGIGIPSETIPNLFQRFTQADNSITRKFGGTGLGLAICRELCALLGGDIDVRSTPGRGSTFRFTVACRPCDAGMEDATAPRSMSTPPVWDAVPPSRVLVVDDNAVNRDILSAMLRRGSHEVTIACDGHEAVSVASQGDFDLILMDIQMPGMDGLTATGIIRRLPPPRGTVPVIAFTAHSTGSDAIDRSAAGMDGFVAKPVRPAELFAEMGRLLGANTGVEPDLAETPRPFDGARTSEPSPANDTKIVDLLDPDQVSVVGDALGAEGWVSACGMFAQSANERIDELRVLVTEGNCHRDAAHTLKGTALNIGAKRLGALALEAEKTSGENLPPLIDDMVATLETTLTALSAHQVAAE